MKNYFIHHHEKDFSLLNATKYDLALPAAGLCLPSWLLPDLPSCGPGSSEGSGSTMGRHHVASSGGGVAKTTCADPNICVGCPPNCEAPISSKVTTN